MNPNTSSKILAPYPLVPTAGTQGVGRKIGCQICKGPISDYNLKNGIPCERCQQGKSYTPQTPVVITVNPANGPVIELKIDLQKIVEALRDGEGLRSDIHCERVDDPNFRPGEFMGTILIALDPNPREDV